MAPIIEVENISKKYNIAHLGQPYVALRDVLTNVMLHPFGFLKQKTKAALGLNTQEDFWALKDVSFKVEQGEILGIIGRNGAGKSTLLKILSQITPPTTGQIKIRGRVGSLLEVGTGFHPELTGRENIYLNGAILGMKKQEIERKFDEIVDFAGIEKFLDTPVKHFSSGMYVRLAFSVAAHLEPDILIVDEVLAVGDSEFQKKSLGKMNEVTKKEGRTVLLVSHNMEAIGSLCSSCVLLESGKISMIGNPKDCIKKYLFNPQREQHKKTFFPSGKNLSLTELEVRQENFEGYFVTDKAITIKVSICAKDVKKDDFICGFNLVDENGSNVLSTYFNDLGTFNRWDRFDGVYTLECRIPQHFLNEGAYRIMMDVGLARTEKFTLDQVHYIEIDVKNINGVGSRYGLGRAWRNSGLLPYFEWNVN